MNNTDCPVTNSLKLIGGKWKIAIIYNLGKGPMRFGELKKTLMPITQQMLTKQLRELEKDGLIIRKIYAEIPPRVEYFISEKGESIMPILDAMFEWGQKNITFEE